MAWLNYHHLLYFWTVAREGSVVRAAERLHLSQPTVSGQIKMLEDALGERLFERSGRRLVLTEAGRLAFGYADEIFTLGRELVDALHDRPTGRPLRLTVGVADVMPKMIVQRLLTPAVSLPEGVQITCLEDKPARLFAALAVHEIDVVLADAPVSAEVRVKAFSHLLGECGVTFFAAPALAGPLKRGFPGSLGQAALLLPTAESALRRSLDQWLSGQGLRPRVAGEFDDSALMTVFGQEGAGVFPAPTVIEADVRRLFGVAVVGRAEAVRERFYAISVEKRLKHPAVVALSDRARQGLFADARTAQGA